MFRTLISRKNVKKMVIRAICFSLFVKKLLRKKLVKLHEIRINDTIFIIFSVIERFKSGDVPPGDFNFEDMHDPQALLSQEPLASTGTQIVIFS